MKLQALILAAGSMPAPEGTTAFSKLSEEAQELILNAMMGEYENGPPEIPESVKQEIQEWASSPD